MLFSGARSAFVIASSALLTTTLALCGCGHSGHPDDRMAVYNALNQHDLRSVNVSQDRGAGTITLSGIVGAAIQKQEAVQFAQQAAPGYSIVDRLKVENAGVQGAIKAAQKDAKLDSAIEDHYEATLAAHKNLKDIHASAYNQTLTLKGSVKTYKEREEAEDLAKKVPKVDHVVNEIQIKGAKTAPANS
jgi:hyperosmotically inducible periplasmic protein